MRYSSQPKFRKYVKGYGFFSSSRKFGDNYSKELIDTVKKNRHTCSKNYFKKSSSKNSKSYRRFDWKQNS